MFSEARFVSCSLRFRLPLCTVQPSSINMCLQEWICLFLHCRRAQLWLGFVKATHLSLNECLLCQCWLSFEINLDVLFGSTSLLPEPALLIQSSEWLQLFVCCNELPLCYRCIDGMNLCLNRPVRCPLLSFLHCTVECRLHHLNGPTMSITIGICCLPSCAATC